LKYRDNKRIVGSPSRKAVELFLSHFGFDFQYYDWENSVKTWDGLIDYKKGNHVTVLAKNID